jgi:hypothetical protein
MIDNRRLVNAWCFALQQHHYKSVNAHACGSGCCIAPSIPHLMDLNEPIWNLLDCFTACLSKLLGPVDGTHILQCTQVPVMG